MSFLEKIIDKKVEEYVGKRGTGSAPSGASDKVAAEIAKQLLVSPAFKEILEKLVETVCDNLKLLTDAGLDALKVYLIKIIDEKVNEAANKAKEGNE